MKFGIMERVRLAAPGKTDQREEKRGKEAYARMKAQYAKDPDSVLRYAEGRGGLIGPRRAENREAAAIVAAEEGKLILDTKDNKYSHRAVANYKAAVARGLDVKDAEKKNPELARFNNRKVDKIIADRPVGSPPLTSQQAEQIAVSGTYVKLNIGEIRNLSDDAVNMNLIRNVSAKKISKAGEEMSQAKIDKLKNSLGDLRAMRQAAGPTTPTGKELTDKINAIDTL